MVAKPILIARIETPTTRAVCPEELVTDGARSNICITICSNFEGSGLIASKS